MDPKNRPTFDELVGQLEQMLQSIGTDAGDAVVTGAVDAGGVASVSEAELRPPPAPASSSASLAVAVDDDDTTPSQETLAALSVAAEASTASAAVTAAASAAVATPVASLMESPLLPSTRKACASEPQPRLCHTRRRRLDEDVYLVPGSSPSEKARCHYVQGHTNR